MDAPSIYPPEILAKYAGQRGRTPGERAFDLCFIPVAALFVSGAMLSIIAVATRPRYQAGAETQIAGEVPPPAWQLWLWFALGMVLALHWLRAARSLHTSWDDPGAQWLRLTSTVLLISLAFTIAGLLAAPLR